MSRPEISVILPVRNAAATLDEALASLAAQTFTHWEAILIDDGSTDATPELLAAWAQRDSRFRPFQAGGSGLVPALNQALELAAAPLCARMDGDDIAHPERFEKQRERLAVGDAAIVGCGVRYFPDELVQDGARRYEAWLNALVTPEDHERDLYIECPLAHPTFMLRTDTLRTLGGYQANGWPEDYDLLLRLAQSGGGMAKVPEVLLYWREGAGRTSRTQPEYALERFPPLRMHYLYRRELREQAAVIFGAGRVGRAHGKALLAAGARLAAYVDLDPRKIGKRFDGAPVLTLAEGITLRGKAYGLAALAQPGQREAIRQTLTAASWEEVRDFRCVA